MGSGVVDLLTLPSYGNYRHAYARMLAAHDELIAATGDRSASAGRSRRRSRCGRTVPWSTPPASAPAPVSWWTP
ncbi:protein of unknown function (plasmid) [Streptantibioticus cattleyicolor NRRL 8057 = DSM 46488]|nr:protein of unknown function [Streptantibioticus cattleyicolor NRRL 8057 = DSM 46488]